MSTPDSISRLLEPGVLVTLYELDLRTKGGPIFYFHDGIAQGSNEIFFRTLLQPVQPGVPYTPFPIRADGFEWTTRGTLPHPKLSVGNVGGIISGYLRAYDDFVGCTLTQRKTFQRYLDTSPHIDAYPASEQNTELAMSGAAADRHYVAQSFTGNGQPLTQAWFWMRKYSGSPTGNMFAWLNAHSGTFGSSSVPGAAIATSEAVPVSPILDTTPPNSFTWAKFYFPTEPVLTAGTRYTIAVQYSGGDTANRVSVGADSTTPTHPGNLSSYITSWIASGTWDLIFYTYNAEPGPPYKEFQAQIFTVERKVVETNSACSFDLSTAMDAEGILLPRRQILATACPFTYRGVECGYPAPNAAGAYPGIGWPITNRLGAYIGPSSTGVPTNFPNATPPYCSLDCSVTGFTFTALDKGKTITGPAFKFGTQIIEYVSPNVVKLDNLALAVTGQRPFWINRVVNKNAWAVGTVYNLWDVAYTMVNGFQVYAISHFAGAQSGHPITIDDGYWWIDTCLKKLVDCEWHFGANKILPYGGFPSADKLQ